MVGHVTNLFMEALPSSLDDLRAILKQGIRNRIRMENSTAQANGQRVIPGYRPTVFLFEFDSSVSATDLSEWCAQHFDDPRTCKESDSHMRVSLDYEPDPKIIESMLMPRFQNSVSARPYPYTTYHVGQT